MKGGKLCLLVSRRCNLRCGFCRVNFTGMDMDWATAKAGIEHYLRSLPSHASGRVKFFGGEPLLNAGLIRTVVDSGRVLWRRRNMRFELSTNGLLLDRELLSYFRARPEVEVTVSQWAPQAATLPGVWFTVVLEPSVVAASLLADLTRLWKAGFRGFNFLPSYYNRWTPRELLELRRSLAAAGRWIGGLWQRGYPARVKNLELWSPVPLYNDAVTLDVDGTFYASNLVQCEGTERFRDSLKLGHIKQEADALRKAAKPSADQLVHIMRSWAGPELWACTSQADALLTEFVNFLEENKTTEAVDS